MITHNLAVYSMQGRITYGVVLSPRVLDPKLQPWMYRCFRGGTRLLRLPRDPGMAGRLGCPRLHLQQPGPSVHAHMEL